MKIEKKVEAEGNREIDELKWVNDSSVDHKGRLPLRASTGSWKAALFIIGNLVVYCAPGKQKFFAFPVANPRLRLPNVNPNMLEDEIKYWRRLAIEFSERLSYFGIATSLVIYLTKVIHQDLKTAAKSVNYWSGVTTLMPLLGGFMADAYLGRYYTVLASCIVYLMGLILLILSWFLPALKPCETHVCTEPRRIHEVVFFLAIYLISMGTGGHKPSLQSFGADQYDDGHAGERRQKLSFFNWWNCGLCSGLILGVTLIVYVQEHANWGVADIILTGAMTFSLIIFIVGRPFYRFRAPTGSPLTPMLQVLVAAISKWKLSCPSNPAGLYEVPKSHSTNGRFLCHTEKLKFLDKAAILVHDGNNSAEKQSPWKLATVTKVEEMKLIINMIPIWIFTLPFGMCVAQTTTFFIKQSVYLNRKVTNHFEIPPASIFSLGAIGMIISVTIYDKILVPILRRITGNERGISILQRIGIGMLFSFTTMIVAANVEKKRLHVVEENPLRGSHSMSVLWLAPQFLIIGFGDGFTLVGLQEYFYDQVPDSMRSLGIAFYLSVLGAANFLSSLLITLVDRVTQKGGRSWFGKDLNSSRLDKFYWLLAAISAVNLVVFTFVARRYSYKNVQRVAIVDCDEGRGDDGGVAETNMV